MTQTKITPAELRRGFPFVLPSGLEVRIRPIDRSLLLKLGDKLPSRVLTIIASTFTSKEELEQAKAEYAKIPVIERLKDDRRYMEEFARLAIVSPRISANPTEDELAIEDLLQEDLEFLWGFYDRPALELRRFSEQQNTVVATLFPVQNPQSTAEQGAQSDADSSADMGRVGEAGSLDTGTV